MAFEPVMISKMSATERQKAQIALAYLTKKRDGTIKGRMVYNDKPTQQWLGKEDNMSPTASLVGILLTAMVDAHEERDIMTTNVPNSFIQTDMIYKRNKDHIIMKITGVLMDIFGKKESTVVQWLLGL